MILSQVFGSEKCRMLMSHCENVASHVAVADQQAVHPYVAGGLVVPQDHLPARLGSGF